MLTSKPLPLKPLPAKPLPLKPKLKISGSIPLPLKPLPEKPFPDNPTNSVLLIELNIIFLSVVPHIYKNIFERKIDFFMQKY